VPVVKPPAARRATPLAALAGALALAACGGGGGHGASDAAKVKQTVQKALAALANHDGAGFCALTTKAAEDELAKTSPGATCTQVVGRISDQLSDDVRVGLRHAQIGKVTFHGDRASIRAGQITATQGTLKGFLQASAPPTNLARQSDGTWKITQ
jgi:hypothetical protein